MDSSPSNKSNNSRDYTLLLLIGLGILLFSVIVFFVGPELVKSRLQEWNITGVDQNGNVTDKGQIGDLFGGTIGPLIAWLAAILTFLAFWIQYVANDDQRKQFEKTSIDTSRERFESRFFAMVEIHRQNAEQINLSPKANGRKAFEPLLLELKMIYWFVYNHYDENPEEVSPGVKASKDLLFEIAYLYFFFGYSDLTVEMISSLTGDTFVPLIESVRDRFIDILYPEQSDDVELETDEEERLEDSNDTPLEKPLVYDNIIEVTSDNGDLVWNNDYKFLAGHLTNLSHYIRHLFQCVKFVDDQNENILSDKDKYDYVSNLRAQLSVYEQALIYYNALSVLGEPWLKTKSDKEESLLVKYCMIKSLPIGLADFHKYPIDHKVLPERNKLGKSTFEWLDIEERLRLRLELSGDLNVEEEDDEHKANS